MICNCKNKIIDTDNLEPTTDKNTFFYTPIELLECTQCIFSEYCDVNGKTIKQACSALGISHKVIKRVYSYEAIFKIGSIEKMITLVNHHS
jgi:hypothetical protein